MVCVQYKTLTEVYLDRLEINAVHSPEVMLAVGECIAKTKPSPKGHRPRPSYGEERNPMVPRLWKRGGGGGTKATEKGEARGEGGFGSPKGGQGHPKEKEKKSTQSSPPREKGRKYLTRAQGRPKEGDQTQSQGKGGSLKGGSPKSQRRGGHYLLLNSSRENRTPSPTPVPAAKAQGK